MSKHDFNGFLAATSEIFDSNVLDNIVGLFSLMDVADEIIKQEIERQPQYEAIIFDTFKYMGPSKWLRDKGEELYRSHCRELIQRAVEGGDMGNLTAAEMCVMFSQTNLRAPLTSEYTSAYSQVFSQAFPDHEVSREKIQEHFPGRNNEIISGLNRKFYDSERAKLAKKNRLEHPLPEQGVTANIDETQVQGELFTTA